MPINELRSIATFVKTAELGSLRQAAAAQGMTPQAASQALAQLEKHLGARLFHRTTRSMALTDAGRQFLDTALPALEHQVLPSLCVNDEELETHAVLAGHAIGQLTAIAAASHIRSGRLVPLLTEHVVEPASAFIYYGSRAAQPLRMRAFITWP